MKLKTINCVSKGEDMKKTYLQLKSSFAQYLYQILEENVHWLKKKLKF